MNLAAKALSQTVIPMNNRTHDFSNPKWGWDVNILNIQNNGLNINLCGWGMNIENGDYLILRNGNETTRYIITSVSYKRDPKDMWFGTADFAPREEVL